MSAPADRLPDVRFLIYEIERLRCTAMELRETTDNVMNNAWEDGAREERQNVVKWLLSRAESAICNKTPECIQLAKYLDDVADAIERGEHRREEDE